MSQLLMLAWCVSLGAVGVVGPGGSDRGAWVHPAADAPATSPARYTGEERVDREQGTRAADEVFGQPAIVDEPVSAPARFKTVLLAVDGFALDQASAELSLRAPDLNVRTQWDASTLSADASGRVFLALRRGVLGVRVEVVTPAGDGYLRDVPGGDLTLRGAVAAAMSLLVSIETAQVVADIGVERMPDSSEPSELDAMRARVDAALDVTVQQEPAPPPPEPTPPLEPTRDLDPFAELVTSNPAEPGPLRPPLWSVGVTAGPIAQFHAAGEMFAEPYDGAGVAMRLALRSRGGAAIEIGGRWIARQSIASRLHRLRIGAGAGYELSRGGWRLPVLAEVGIEPWWIRRIGGDRVTPSAFENLGPSASVLLSGAVALRPAYQFEVVSPGVHAIRVGLSANVGAAFAIDEQGVVIVGVAADELPGSEMARLGGLELAAAIETTFFFGRR